MTEQEITAADYFLKFYKIWNELCTRNKTIETNLLRTFKETNFYANAKTTPSGETILKIEECLVSMNYTFLKLYELCALLPLLFADSNDKDTSKRFAAACGFDKERESLVNEYHAYLSSMKEWTKLYWLSDNLGNIEKSEDQGIN